MIKHELVVVTVQSRIKIMHACVKINLILYGSPSYGAQNLYENLQPYFQTRAKFHEPNF